MQEILIDAIHNIRSKNIGPFDYLSIENVARYLNKEYLNNNFGENIKIEEFARKLGFDIKISDMMYDDCQAILDINLEAYKENPVTRSNKVIFLSPDLDQVYHKFVIASLIGRYIFDYKMEKEFVAKWKNSEESFKNPFKVRGDVFATEFLCQTPSLNMLINYMITLSHKISEPLSEFEFSNVLSRITDIPAEYLYPKFAFLGVKYSNLV